ncbi:MAG: glycosyltransferase family 2 protein [Bacteroidales bacterium]|jgi:glycosyltransferase involved in cell wall biosynthesis|nr:glycosyltransferase family 2 protein [Bacteroidales bacterium]
MISIIIPMYNRATLVSETLDSVLAQTYTDWECIVVDDGSTDNSVEVVQKYVDKDSRFKLLSRPENRIKGAPTCRNIGYINSVGELVYFLDSDDILTPQLLETVSVRMNKKPEADFALVPFDFFTDKSKKSFSPHNYQIIDDSVFEKFISLKISPAPLSFIWRRRLFEHTKELWKEGLRKGQDLDFAFRMITLAQQCTVINMCPMNHYRLHNDQMTHKSLKVSEFGMILNEVYINSFIFLDEKGKLIPKYKKLYLRGMIKIGLGLIIKYGNIKAAWKNYVFIRDQSQNMTGCIGIRVCAYLSWLLAPMIFFFGQYLYQRKNSQLINWFKKIVFK